MSEWDDIQAAIKAIQHQLESIEETNKSWKIVAETSAAEQKVIKREFDAEMQRLHQKFDADTAQLRQDQYTAQAEMRKTYSEIQLLKDRLNGLNKNATTLLEKQAASQKLAGAEKKIIEIAAQSLWWTMGAEFQREDITFIVNAYLEGKRGVANFNDMGTGKTMETAGAIRSPDAFVLHARRTDAETFVADQEVSHAVKHRRGFEVDAR